MSLTQDHGDFIFQCDGSPRGRAGAAGKGCHETIETRTSNFDSAQNALHRNHWKAKKIDGEWKHFCPDCQGTLI